MEKQKKFFGRLLAAIGSIFAPAFRGAEKAYNALPEDQKQALKDGSGIIDFINTRLEGIPADIKTALQTEFPYQDIAKIEQTARDVAEAFNLIREGEEFSLEELIEKLQQYLKAQKTKGGKFWAIASHSIAAIFAVLFGPADAKVSVVASLLEYVYHAFIKKDKPA